MLQQQETLYFGQISWIARAIPNIKTLFVQDFDMPIQ